MDWYLAIRNAKLIRRKIGLPHLSNKELVDGLTRDFVLEGFLYKTGSGVKDAWRRRWFTLDGTTIYYFNDPLVRYFGVQMSFSVSTNVSDCCDI